MKRIIAAILMFVLLVGCDGTETSDRAMMLRTRILEGDGCEFKANITADYLDVLYVFDMHCVSDAFGNITFEVLSPDSITGITGKIGAEGGKLTFDEYALLFSMLADGNISPVSAPWLMLRALRSGYISGCAENDEGLSIHIDDSYKDEPLQLTIQTNSESLPVSAEVYDRGSRILTIVVEDFLFL